MYQFAYVYTCVYIHIYVYESIYSGVYVSRCVYIHICVERMYVYIRMNICTKAYTHTLTHTYEHSHIYKGIAQNMFSHFVYGLGVRVHGLVFRDEGLGIVNRFQRSLLMTQFHFAWGGFLPCFFGGFLIGFIVC